MNYCQRENFEFYKLNYNKWEDQDNGNIIKSYYDNSKDPVPDILKKLKRLIDNYNQEEKNYSNMKYYYNQKYSQITFKFEGKNYSKKEESDSYFISVSIPQMAILEFIDKGVDRAR